MSEQQNGIAAIRKRLGGSLESFGAAAGLSPSGYWRKEVGQSSFSAEEAVRLVDFLKREYKVKVEVRDLCREDR